MKNIKVLQINSVCGVGSTGRIATDIHHILEEQGHESYVAFGRNEPLNCKNSIRIGNKFDNYVHVGLTRMFDKHGFGSKRATTRFLKEVKKLEPDVIHLHNIHGYYINIGLLFDYLKKADTRVIWTLHDCWAFTGHCSHFDYIRCDKWKTGCFDCPQLKEYPKSSFADNSKRNFNQKKSLFTGVKGLTIVTPSKWLAGLVAESFLSDYPIKVINNGIDLSIFRPTSSDFRKINDLEDKFIILGVSNVWSEKKGLHHFIELSNYLQTDEVIVLVGLTDKEMASLPPKVIGITKTDTLKKLAEIYSTADIFLNPTLEDTFPTTNLESLACGTPVITFNTGGSIESIDEKSGIVVAKGNNEGLREAVKIARKMESLGVSQHCLYRSFKLYNKEYKFQEYVSLYIDNEVGS